MANVCNTIKRYGIGRDIDNEIEIKYSSVAVHREYAEQPLLKVILNVFFIPESPPVTYLEWSNKMTNRKEKK